MRQKIPELTEKEQAIVKVEKFKPFSVGVDKKLAAEVKNRKTQKAITKISNLP